MFELIYDYTILDSIYDDEPFYNNDWYKLCYNGKDLYVYDEENYPLSLNLEVANITKHVTLYIPFIKDNFKNADLFKEGIKHSIDVINRVFKNGNYDIELYYENE